MKFNRKWAAMGVLAAMQLLGKVKDNALDVARIYGATAYLKGVLMVREFVLYHIGLLVGALLFVFGAILIEVAAVFYISAETATRVLLCFALGGINLLIGGVILAYFSSSKRWLRKASKYSLVLKGVMEKSKNSKFEKEGLMDSLLRRNQKGGLKGSLLLWLIGVPVPVIILIFFLRGCQ